MAADIGVRFGMRSRGECQIHGVGAVTGAGFPFFNLYRGVVILRGKRLVTDVSAGQGRPVSLTARAVMIFFRHLFRLNMDSCAWGWQMVATARVPIQS